MTGPAHCPPWCDSGHDRCDELLHARKLGSCVALVQEGEVRYDRQQRRVLFDYDPPHAILSLEDARLGAAELRDLAGQLLAAADLLEAGEASRG